VLAPVIHQQKPRESKQEMPPQELGVLSFSSFIPFPQYFTNSLWPRWSRPYTSNLHLRLFIKKKPDSALKAADIYQNPASEESPLPIVGSLHSINPKTAYLLSVPNISHKIIKVRVRAQKTPGRHAGELASAYPNSDAGSPLFYFLLPNSEIRPSLPLTAITTKRPLNFSRLRLSIV
jgi:hypothetical protein